MVLMRQGTTAGCACNDWALEQGELVCRDCGSTLNHKPDEPQSVCVVQPNCLRPATHWVHGQNIVWGPMCLLHAKAFIATRLVEEWFITSDPNDLGGQ